MRGLSVNATPASDKEMLARGALDLMGSGLPGFALGILGASPDCIKLIDLEGRVSFMSENGMCAMEIEDFGTVAGLRWTSLWPLEAKETLETALTAARDGKLTEFEAFCPTAKGTPRWWSVTVTPVRNQMGEVHLILASSRDVTETVNARRMLEEQAATLAREVAEKDTALARQKVLLAEIDHRVKNSFAAVIGLLNLQARSHTDPALREAVAQAASRIATLARVHDQLYRDPESDHLPLAAFASGLLADLDRALTGTVRADILVPKEMLLSVNAATALGQVMAELVGNAIKHAGRECLPIVEVTLAAKGEGRLLLSVSDNGPGLPPDFDPAARHGLGMRILSIYSDQLDADLTCGNTPEGGAMFRLDFPVR
ncbi:sensor histidine kinase [Haematobacter genomosp. 1]|uniref:histidine kinase n=1 Tax=Haematobacter genomosp. 1 TaxID=366618 RepID=A0A212A7Z7_9RHOB|nr:histidine kinase dimerization/phosphoacceptor domain -containing protein [Haematobacter genomosp. 1]OWJ75915.1 hypothetical protein CDV49_15960 [Haematobacter genomosp. 1]